MTSEVDDIIGIEEESRYSNSDMRTYHNIYIEEKEARRTLAKLRSKFWEKELLTVDEWDNIVNCPRHYNVIKYIWGWTSLDGVRTWRDSRNHFHIAMTIPPIPIKVKKKGAKLA